MNRETQNRTLAWIGAILAIVVFIILVLALTVQMPRDTVMIALSLASLAALVLFRLGRSPSEARARLLLPTVFLWLGLTAGATAAVLADNFDLRQGVAAWRLEEGRLFKFAIERTESNGTLTRQCAAILRRRLDPYAAGWVRVAAVDDHTLTVAIDERFAESSEVDEDIRTECTRRGVLEFRILAARAPESPSILLDSESQEPDSVDRYVAELAQHGPRRDHRDRYAWFEIEDPLGFLRADDLEELEFRKGNPLYPIVDAHEGSYYVLTLNAPGYRMLQDRVLPMCGDQLWRQSSSRARVPNVPPRTLCKPRTPTRSECDEYGYFYGYSA